MAFRRKRSRRNFRRGKRRSRRIGRYKSTRGGIRL